MKLLQVIILCLLLPSLYSSKENADGKNATIGGSPSISTTEKSVSTPSMTPNPVSESTTGISSNGTTNKESLSTPLPPTFSSLTTTITDEGKKTEGVMKNPTTANPTVTSPPLSNTVSTPQSSQHKTENQSSTKTTETPGNTPHPETPPSNASTLPSISATIPGNISQFQGTEDAKNASSSSANPSYSSIILPVVIALIVVTLSAFILVGLYRMCRKTDPGTPENGNDQPQSDKESVKLLTVKTISHEPGEHSAQGKTKN